MNHSVALDNMTEAQALLYIEHMFNKEMEKDFRERIFEKGRHYAIRFGDVVYCQTVTDSICADAPRKLEGTKIINPDVSNHSKDSVAYMVHNEALKRNAITSLSTPEFFEYMTNKKFRDEHDKPSPIFFDYNPLPGGWVKEIIEGGAEPKNIFKIIRDYNADPKGKALFVDEKLGTARVEEIKTDPKDVAPRPENKIPTPKEAEGTRMQRHKDLFNDLEKAFATVERPNKLRQALQAIADYPAYSDVMKMRGNEWFNYSQALDYTIKRMREIAKEAL